MDLMTDAGEDLVDAAELITEDELRLAARNHGMPLEALRYPITPVGLHYLLIHYDIPEVDEASFTLTIAGRVRRPTTLTLADLQTRPAAVAAVTMECAGNGRAHLKPRPISQPWLLGATGTAEWTGTPLRSLLEEAGLLDDAVEVVFTGLDHGVEKGVEQDYQRGLPLAEAMRTETLLAYAMNGQPLLPQHGFPLRLVVPGWYGMTNVKWLTRITVVAQPFAGYQQVRGYHLRTDDDDPGTPVTRMMPRALMVAPGIPDFLTRRRFVRPGSHRLRGRAWSGWAPIRAVDVSVDGGRTWAAGQLEAQPSGFAWCGWSCSWTASPGDHELCCRAIDESGRQQPLDIPWNVGGYANNAVQRIHVTVTDQPGDVLEPAV